MRGCHSDMGKGMIVADTFTKWVGAFPVPNMEAETVAEVVACEIICPFGMP